MPFPDPRSRDAYSGYAARHSDAACAGFVSSSAGLHVLHPREPSLSPPSTPPPLLSPWLRIVPLVNNLTLSRQFVRRDEASTPCSAREQAVLQTSATAPSTRWLGCSRLKLAPGSDEWNSRG